ncbi:hypothetical protein H257_15840 [Aphanomyces astaci]|uniref:Uncharacterized protein n=1 Tax=Aphanomyces astaci TaxID=112090 RepID=W4FMH3_APHAT|nr:hypothetical protein H257_15840 [Aphanomyces astaci]ETV68081.1 hypothetical protein H257_15840 [Aphanomyces astaci]|eukprot:XP_009842380.1 hypothetical protein H257_15840 [Aphanomyces astaci]
MSAAYVSEKAVLHDAILEQMREVMMGLHTLNQNLERLNDVGGELQSIAHAWTTFCSNITRSPTDVDVGIDVEQQGNMQAS